MNWKSEYQVTAFGETNDPNTLICTLGRDGFGKLTIDPDTKDITVEKLFNPLESEEFGGGPHPPTERFNDGKVSPDGKFFSGTFDGAVAAKMTEVKKYYWTMNGNNEMAPLLYRYDNEKNSAIVQKDVGHHIVCNGPTWSLDGTKFYYTCSLSGQIREYDYDKDTSTVKGEGRVVITTDKVSSANVILDGSTIDS